MSEPINAYHKPVTMHAKRKVAHAPACDCADVGRLLGVRRSTFSALLAIPTFNIANETSDMVRNFIEHRTESREER
jgi:hypothetical protein